VGHLQVRQPHPEHPALPLSGVGLHGGELPRGCMAQLYRCTDAQELKYTRARAWRDVPADLLSVVTHLPPPEAMLPGAADALAARCSAWQPSSAPNRAPCPFRAPAEQNDTWGYEMAPKCTELLLRNRVPSDYIEVGARLVRRAAGTGCASCPCWPGHTACWCEVVPGAVREQVLPAQPAVTSQPVR